MQRIVFYHNLAAVCSDKNAGQSFAFGLWCKNSARDSFYPQELPILEYPHVLDTASQKMQPGQPKQYSSKCYGVVIFQVRANSNAGNKDCREQNKRCISVISEPYRANDMVNSLLRHFASVKPLSSVFKWISIHFYPKLSAAFSLCPHLYYILLCRYCQ